MHGQARAFVEFARVSVHVPPARFVDVQPNHLVAERTFRHNRMEPPSAEQLDELEHPYG
jgi:hypothetical protein